MCRYQLRFVPSVLTQFIVALVLITCRPDDVVPATYSLEKGQVLNQPALISVGLKEFTGISAQTSADKILSDLKTVRPTQIKDYLNDKVYNQGIITRIRILDLPKYTFTWNSTKRKIMMVSLFKQVIQISNNQIANPQDIVWLWTPPAGTTDPGTASFSGGKIASYRNKKFALSDIPQTNPLPLGIYVWAVWAWEDKGLTIVASSRELPLEITN